ncbi:MAG TPA: hypothetical protein VFI06_00280 [Chitinophagaceae bacterium]|nr:hypothetical protein [Chitinophagaceae bacterium]
MSDIPASQFLFATPYDLPVEVVIILVLAIVIGCGVNAIKRKPQK